VAGDAAGGGGQRENWKNRSPSRISRGPRFGPLVNDQDTALRDFLKGLDILLTSDQYTADDHTTYLQKLRTLLDRVDRFPKPLESGVARDHFANGIHKFAPKSAPRSPAPFQRCSAIGVGTSRCIGTSVPSRTNVWATTTERNTTP